MYRVVASRLPHWHHSDYPIWEVSPGFKSLTGPTKDFEKMMMVAVGLELSMK